MLKTIIMGFSSQMTLHTYIYQNKHSNYKHCYLFMYCEPIFENAIACAITQKQCKVKLETGAPYLIYSCTWIKSLNSTHVSLWCLFLDPHRSTYQSTYACPIKRNNRITPAYLMPSLAPRRWISDDEAHQGSKIG